MTSPDHNNPLVSVVVTTRNEERNIGNCLKSIQLQTYKPIEVIVVDNNSTDETKEIALGFTDVVVDKGPERSAQRNHGIRDLANGKYAMFIDADMIMTPNLVQGCVDHISRTDSVALHVGEEVLGVGLLARVRRFERSFYSGTCVDGVRFFNRNIFCQIGGFDENLPPGPEDWDLDKRFKAIGPISLVDTGALFSEWELTSLLQNNGAKFNRNLVGVYHNESEQSLKQYLKKKTYYSSSMKVYKEKWGPNDPDVKKQLGIIYRYLIVFVENGKWNKLIRHPVYSALMLSLRCTVGVIFVISNTFKMK
jgi:glycosyltransferase involved in cell wall biosynthesis